MSQKLAKKSLWVECERCHCNILSNDKNTHVELNCSKDQVKCPFIDENIFYTWLERASAPPENVPRDAVMVHPSAGALIGAVIGKPLELKRDGALTLVKRMWPSKASAPAAVILPAAGIFSNSLLMFTNLVTQGF